MNRRLGFHGTASPPLARNGGSVADRRDPARHRLGHLAGAHAGVFPGLQPLQQVLSQRPGRAKTPTYNRRRGCSSVVEHLPFKQGVESSILSAPRTTIDLRYTPSSAVVPPAHSDRILAACRQSSEGGHMKPQTSKPVVLHDGEGDAT